MSLCHQEGMFAGSPSGAVKQVGVGIDPEVPAEHASIASSINRGFFKDSSMISLQSIRV
jgi:hypothetical protein